MSNEYFVRTEQFEGPMDLLLHLVKVYEIDIFDIDVLKLTREYLDFLRKMRFADLGQASEFIEMAATLIEIKTRLLLPHDEKGATDDGDSDDDPLRTLQERLIQYEAFRNAAEHFSQMPQLGVEIQTNTEWDRLGPLYEHVEAPLTGDSASMVIMYEQMLRGLLDRKKSVVTRKLHAISVEEVIDRLERDLEAQRFALFQGYYNRFQSRYELVAYVLAMLELSKMKKLKMYQQELKGPLWIYRFEFESDILPVDHGGHGLPGFTEGGPNVAMEQ